MSASTLAVLIRDKALSLHNNQIETVFRSIYTFKHHRRWFYTRRTFCTQSEQKEDFPPIERIRNFSIIAHVDHGKSTLADRLLEFTGAIKANSGKQILDKLQVEKDRGITVKAQTVCLNYTHENENYFLNLIDTPGHVDFASEVYRSLAPCQGVILLVDANDGVQAQTVANFDLALQRELIVVPVINKIDLKYANPDKVVEQLKRLFDIDPSDVLKISAKLGTGIDKVLDAVVERIPPPLVNREEKFRALIFDSWYENYKGAVSLIYVTEGSVSVGEQITSVHTKKSYAVRKLWLLKPDEMYIQTLVAGQVGCLACTMRTSQEAFIGDTLHAKNECVEPLIGFEPPKPMVFAGVYPMSQSDHPKLRDSIEKLLLNDNAVSVNIDSSPALGQGWRLGFLGLLHMEVFVQRLEQEYGAEPIVTSPGVTYKAKIFGLKNIKKYTVDLITFDNPVHFPDPQIVTEYYEPMVLGTIITPNKYISQIKTLCRDNRGVEQSETEIDLERVMMKIVLPLNEIIIDFHDSLKCLSSGYASFDYEDIGFEVSDIVKLKILLNRIEVDELSTIVHRSKSQQMAKQMCGKLLKVIPRQQYEISIQAAIGSKILAREDLKAYRKDVTAKLYGGDVTRRKKLLARQAEGKKKMKILANIALPRETFINVLKK